MRYKLSSVFLVLLIILTDTHGLSVNIIPIPAAVIAGDNLIVTSKITKIETETWKSFAFYVVDGDSNTVCGGTPDFAHACSNVFGCSYGFGFSCNYTHFNLLLNNVGLSLIGLSVYAEVTIIGSPKVISVSTTIEVEIPLRGVSLTPNGTITKTESETQVFRCFARSFPISNLSWHLSGSMLPTPSSPVTTTDTVTSSYTYTAQKEDNDKRLSCTAVSDSTSFTEGVLINVLYRPTVYISPKYNPFRVLENTTDLELTCNVTDANPAVSSFTWTKNGSMISGVDSTYTIPTVHRSHTGSYTCGATNSVGNSEPSTAIQLEVLYGIDITTITKQEPFEGTQLTINCNGQSYPEVSDNDVTWTKQINTKFSIKKRQLVIDNINRLDSGNYVCSVVITLTPTAGQPRNVTGRTTVEVDVLYRPKVTISPKYIQYNVTENTTNLKFDCTVVDANPIVTSYRWYKDGSLIDGSNSSSYTISTVLRSHTGSYTCDATNYVGSSDLSSAVQLNVLYGVDINIIGKTDPTELTHFVVSCNIKSNPEVTVNDVTWTKQNNVTFSRKGQQLVIESVHRMDSGTYVCSVVLELIPTLGQSVNVNGTTTVEVNVLYKPTVTVTPDFNQYNVIENTTNLNITCNVIDANPAVTSYRWYKDSSLISNTASYTISTVHRTQTGSYTCDATNDVGDSIVSSAVQLNILYGVELNPIHKTIQTEGNQLTITCNGQSNPMMTDNEVNWSKQNNNTYNMVGLELVIHKVNRLDKGTYVCSVEIKLTPTIGQPIIVTGSTTVDIEVLYRPDVVVLPGINPYHVKENTSNLLLICNVTDANPAVTSYRWYKDSVKVSTAETYTISTVYRSHAGSYTCDANNTVGSSDPSSVVELDVLYGVSLKLSGTEISINESDRWDLVCIGSGNPVPNITCVYGYNRTTVGEQIKNVTSISVNNANCMDTGLYMCFGNNTIGETVSQSAEIKVECKPRTPDNVKEHNIFINDTDKSLSISTTFISFPSSDISWFRELPDGNFTDIDNEFITSTTTSDLPYETISILQKDQLKQDDFGIYFVNASNIHGTFLLKYHFIAKRAPDMPTHITASCDVTSIKVTWIAGFNGGDNQTFRINFADTISNQTILFKDEMANRRDDKNMNVVKEFVSPDTLYRIFLETYNLYGTTKSTEISNCTTQKNQEENQRLKTLLVAFSIFVVIIILVIGGLYYWRRRTFPGGNKKVIKRELNETDDEQDGLKDNPLYVTSGEVSNAEEGPAYGVVNKPKQNKENVDSDDKKNQGPVYADVQKSSTHDNYTAIELDGLKDNPLYVTSGEVSNAEEGPVYGVVNKPTQNKENVDSDDKKNQGPVYADVQKLSTHGKKKQNKKKTKDTSKKENNTGIELGTIYENSDKLFKHTDTEELYANAGEQDDGIILPVAHTPKKNKDGLVYADVDLLPGPSGNRFVIRGQENRTNYAILDLSKKAEPLPSDNEDEDKDSTNVN